MPKKKIKKSKTFNKSKKVKHGRNRNNNVLIKKIMPKTKQLHKKQGISMTEAIKKALKEYHDNKL